MYSAHDRSLDDFPAFSGVPGKSLAHHSFDVQDRRVQESVQPFDLKAIPLTLQQSYPREAYRVGAARTAGTEDPGQRNVRIPARMQVQIEPLAVIEDEEHVQLLQQFYAVQPFDILRQDLYH